MTIRGERVRQIVAMGGGGFSMEPRNLRLDRYVLGLVGRRKPRVCFLPTASGEAESYVERFYRAFGKLRCSPTHLSLFETPVGDLREFVLEQDVIYVGGGNSRSMLAVWREWSLDRILAQAWRRGVVLAGLSAGSICWFEYGVTDSLSERLSPLECLGFLEGSNCPHYDGEAQRRPAYRRFIRQGLMPGGLAADDGVALHFVGRRLARVVASRRGPRAYRVERKGKRIVETPIIPEVLQA